MISIIIVARNLKDPKLADCLESISMQTHKDYEVIIETEGTIQEARKEAIKRAKGEWICLVDSDQWLMPDLLDYCISLCEEGEYDGVTWTERAKSTDTFMEKVIDYDKKLFHAAQDDDPIKGAAEPRFFRASFLKQLDWDKLPPVTFELTFINKQVNDMGANIGFINKTLALHNEPKNTIELFRKFFRYGYYYLPALAIDRGTILSHSSPRRVYFSLKAISHPILYWGLWYSYFIKAIASALGAISYYFR
jgi:glycosyltransferase involved in cell wall biosynthesis